MLIFTVLSLALTLYINNKPQRHAKSKSTTNLEFTYRLFFIIFIKFGLRYVEFLT